MERHDFETAVRKGGSLRVGRRDSSLRPWTGVLMGLVALHLSAVAACSGNSAPVAADRSISLDEDESQVVVLGASDSDGDSLTWYIVVEPQHGSIDGVLPNLTYTPAANYFGWDVFTYKVNDGETDSNIGIVSIHVNGIPDVPVAYSDTISLEEDWPRTFTLPAFDPDGDKLEYTIVDQPARGTLDVEEIPTVTYAPDENFAGNDSFTFRVDDGESESEVAIISLEVAASNDPPVPDERTVTTREDTPVDIELGGVDPEGSDVSVFIIAAPTHGTLSATALPTVTYTPDENYVGEDTITFIASDGERESEPAEISIVVLSVNDPPTVTDLVVTTTEDNPLIFELPVDDIDTPGTDLSVTLLEIPNNGRLYESEGVDAIAEDDLPLPLEDLTLYYVPPRDFFSPGIPPVPEAFDARVSDGESEATGTVHLVVLEGGIIYVSPDGDDAFDGRTEDRPMRTIAAALRRTDPVDQYQEPDTVLLGEGRYCESGLEIDHSVRIAGIGMEESVIDGSALGGYCGDAQIDEFHSTMLATCEVRIQNEWPDSGVLRVSADGAELLEVELSDLSITNGTNTSPGGAIYNTERLTLDRVRLHNNCSTSAGGALANERPVTIPTGEDLADWGELIITDSEVVGNGALHGGGLSNSGSLGLRGTLVAENEAIVVGGGIYNIADERTPDASKLSILDESSISFNKALRHGGGIYAVGYDLALLDSAVESNLAGILGDDGLGGGIFAVANAGQPFTLVSSSISQNNAPFYGGMYLEAYEVGIGDAQINDNHAEQSFGGAYIVGDYTVETSVGIYGNTEIRGNDSDGDSAGVALEGVDATIIQAVIAENVSAGYGGGIYVTNSRVLFEEVEITENQAAIGGGVLIDEDGFVEIEETEVTFNVATELGGGLAQLSGQTTIYETVVFEGNSAWPLDPDIDNETQKGGGIGLSGGALFLQGPLITDNESADWGGGVYSELSELSIEEGTQITANRAISAGTDIDLLDGTVPAGGGVYFTQGGLVISRAAISGNRSEVLGGGLATVWAQAHIESTILSSNSAHATVESGAGREIQQGGGLYTDGTHFLIVDSTFADNYTADQGGGAFLYSSDGVILRSTVSGNSAAQGDDPAGDAFAEGGGLYIASADVSILNSTLSGNWADWEGGAILGADSDVNLFYDTVTANGSGSSGALANVDTDWVFHALAVANNEPGGDCEGIDEPISAYSLDSDDSCTLGPFDLEQDNPYLEEELSDNGGINLTHALLDDSPLIDAVPTEECLFQLNNFGVPLTDQRSEGYVRPVGDGCDIGAFERQ